MSELSTQYLRDPLQGFDLSVSVTSYTGGSPVLEGVFTGFMCRITNQTEAYLTLNARIPRMLDGEITIAWHLEQGQVNDNALSNTFGNAFAAGLAKGRGNAIPRSQRFKITMACDTLSIPSINEATFASENTNVSDIKLKLEVAYARIDTGSFGMAAGKRVASSAWQGTGEYIVVNPTT